MRTNNNTAQTIQQKNKNSSEMANFNYLRNSLEYMKYTKARKLVDNYVVLDFETTGLDPYDSEIIQIGAVKYNNHQIIDEFTTYVNPLTSISERITKINGINNNTVKDAPLIEDALPELINFIGDYHLVAHNASFDMKFLLYKMNKNGITYKKYRVIDTLPLARKYIKTSNHKLVTLKEHFKLYDYKSHNALDDCYVTSEVYKHCYEMEINPPLLTFKDVDDYENAFELYDIGERLYKNKQIDDAEKYLLASIDKGNDAPAPFERLAIIYRKQKRYQDEINICELGLKAISNGPAAYQSNLFIKRIERAKELL